MRIDIFKITTVLIEVGTSDDTVNRFVSEFLCNWQNRDHNRQVTFSKNDIPYLIDDYLSRAHIRRKDRGAASTALNKWMNALPYTNKFITLRVEAYEECDCEIAEPPSCDRPVNLQCNESFGPRVAMSDNYATTFHEAGSGALTLAAASS